MNQLERLTWVVKVILPCLYFTAVISVLIVCLICSGRFGHSWIILDKSVSWEVDSSFGALDFALSLVIIGVFEGASGVCSNPTRPINFHAVNLLN